MELFQEYREKSKRSIIIADHMVSVTYNLVRDPKLLLSVIENTLLSLSYAMSSLLQYELLFKRVSPFEDSFDARFELFKEVAAKYNISVEFISLIIDVKGLISSHKNASVEFSRNDKLVICSDNYRIISVSMDDIKKHIIKAKLFIQEISNITSKDVSIFRNEQS
jgi:hypothetical protein|tara:strand:+ start:54 stop:548 length:495 start_codon:yes stop_codon:yes gene_type:complete